MILWITLGCFVAYIVGLILLVRVMPNLLKHAFDEALFIGAAAIAIFGAMLTFGAIGVTFTIFSGELGVRLVDALFLLVLGIVTLRTSIKAFRAHYNGYQIVGRASRIMTGSFFLLLTATAVATLALLFMPA